MAETAVELRADETAPKPATDTRKATRTQARSMLKELLTPVASLKLTVMLFLLSLGLVLCGTLAQRFEGINTVLEKYFRAWGIVWFPFQLFLPQALRVSGRFPYPGGWLLGSLLMSNLLAAHSVRFKLSWKRAGILILHAGLVVMFCSEFVTGLWAVEGNMTIREGSSSNYIEHISSTELAVIDRSDPKSEDVVVVPGRMLRRGGLIRHDLLPFDIEVVQYLVNSGLVEQKRMLTAIVPYADSTWVFKVVGALTAVADQKQAFEGFIRSVRLGSEDDRPIVWTVPEGWREQPPQESRYAEILMGADTQDPLLLTVTRLGRDAGSLLDNVNRWRGQLGLDPISQSELANLIATVQLNEATATVVDLSNDTQHNPATAGDGLAFLAVERPEVSGTDPDQKVDISSAYVTLKKKGTGEPLGTYLVSLKLYDLDRPQIVTFGEKSYEMLLRFKRTYKPYTLNLLDFKHDIYLGTDKPKDYSSYVRLEDPARNENREVRIWMNHPLRHAGETFYQSSFLPGDTGTILQVVKNPGWLMPYISCTMVAIGMLVHFGGNLYTFLRRKGLSPSEAPVRMALGPILFAPVYLLRRKLAPKPAKARKRGRRRGPAEVFDPEEPMDADYSALLPLSALILATGYLVSQMFPAHSEGPMRIDDFGRLPVVYQARLEPIDTLARNSLMIISNRQTYRDAADKEQPAIRWLLDVFAYRMGSDAAAKHKVFRIENEEALKVLGLESRPGLRYALDEFVNKMDVLQEQANDAARVAAPERTFYQNKIIEVAKHVDLFANLSRLTIPHMLPPQSSDEEWQSYATAYAEAVGPLMAQVRAEATRSQVDLSKLGPAFWTKVDAIAAENLAAHNPAAHTIHQMLTAYASGDSDTFNRLVAEYRGSLRATASASLPKASFEVFFNRFAPFYHCSILYLGAFLLACCAWLGWSKLFNQAAFWLLLPTFLVHSFALVARMYLMDRWFVFVTNLYSSAIFIGWGCALLAMVLERIFHNGIGNALGGVIGFLTLLVAHGLALAADGDTLEMMQAVLDTNFWLATHVTCVTTGYAATFLAGFIAIAFVVAGFSVRLTGGDLSRDLVQTFGRMIYGIVCFAALFSFVGTVLGGIWADQSWGRFWGWDPKENGALMIVIWNALILHARWGGMVQQRGMALLAILGNMVTAWSWFGVNQLGIGLHAYGFSNSLAFWLLMFIASQIVMLSVGGLWTLLERSYRLRAVAIN